MVYPDSSLSLLYYVRSTSEMKEQMQSATSGEFHSIAYVTRKRANEGMQTADNHYVIKRF